MNGKALSSRERLLELIRLLQQFTDEQNALTIHEIHSMFPESTNVSLASVRDDLTALENSNQFPVIAMQEKVGTVKHYYYDGWIFELHELRLLIDAISAAQFIPLSERKTMHMKLRTLTSKNLAPLLQNELMVDDSLREENNQLILRIKYLHEAIMEKRVITFQYGRFDVHLNFNLSHAGKQYKVDPLGLIWNNDRYYLVGRNHEYDEIRQYRVDRMRAMKIHELAFVPDPHFDLKKHSEKMVHMFGGEPISVEIQFSSRLINMVIDRFGTNARIINQSDDTFILKTEVAMSDGLVGWILRWGGDAHVIYPQKLRGEIQAEVRKLADLYKIVE